ncbi:MAG: radical SAM/SPASM domain-containing protein [Chloroflexi bacterium RBG_16_50_9]|nr:MAG: radical SAM/SPASM domain-containing protein [Chloroflexi bacterium RBG_16_50_9]
MTIENETKNRPADFITPGLQMIAWEITRSCNLFCAHCRASAHKGGYEGELTTAECFRVIDGILDVGRPMIILTGGEPLLRPDVLEIARYAAQKGLRVVMGTNGTLVTEETAARLKEIPVACIGVSLDFPSAERHDNFRCQVGAFNVAMVGIKNARQAGIDIQINSTISKINVTYIGELLSLALQVGARSFHPFLLLPTGRGKDMADTELSPLEYEQTLNWICDKTEEYRGRLAIRPICAPHFMRITRQKQKMRGVSAQPRPAPAAGGHPGHGGNSRGCMCGTGFVFISHRGIVQGCGYLDIEAGNLRKSSFSEIWNNSPLFTDLRDLGKYHGKCGICEYKRICGGCRARAYETGGGYLEAEPYCIYQPGQNLKT